MSVRNLVSSNDPILRNKTKQIDNAMFMNSNRKSGKYLKKLIIDMQDTLIDIYNSRNYKNDEVVNALASNQIGIKERLYVVFKTKIKDDKLAVEFEEYINPEILSKSDETSLSKEECFSFPRKIFHIERSDNVKIKYQNIMGGWKVEELSDFNAIIAQHEIDHLNGITPEDRATVIEEV